jgi:DNA-binding NtrC family response regulator
MQKATQESAAGYPALPILIVDDDEDTLSSYKRMLEKNGINHLLLCQNSREAARMSSVHPLSLVLLDLAMPELSGQELLQQLKTANPQLPVIVVTGSSEIQDAIACMKLGANDYLLKPVEPNRFLAAVRNALEVHELANEVHSLKEQILAPELKQPEAFAALLTISPKMLAIFKYIEAIAASPRPVLITGESGVGKELVAQALHRLSKREGELVAVNIAGLDDTVFSDTLFGHHKGAFTGADRKRDGLITKAAGGTLFLDEIGNMSLDFQTKMLRVIEYQQFERVGGGKTIKVDVRIIAATNANLEKDMKEERFREDLYDRLAFETIWVPPLRDRKEDIEPLCYHFMKKLSEEIPGVKPKAISPETLDLMLKYDWHGNIRELKYVIERITYKLDGDTILPHHLPEEIRT